MVFWFDFYTGQYRNGDHRKDAPHFHFLETPESVKDPTDDYAPSLFVEFDFFFEIEILVKLSKNSKKILPMISEILKCVTSYILDVLDTLHLNWDLGLTSNRTLAT